MTTLLDHIHRLQAAGTAMGTEVSEYIESKVPRQCGTCSYMVGNTLCSHKVVLRDPEVQTDKGTGLKIVDPLLGCCRYWEPAKKLNK